MNGIIFVVDSSANQDQLSEVRETLHQVLVETREFAVPILILANKQDIKSAIAPIEMHAQLNIDQLPNE